jgi:hypothetical protein
VRSDISHLSETVSCFFEWYDYTTITCFTKYFYLIKSAREQEEAMYDTYHAPHPNIVTMASSPLSEIMSKHDEDMGYIGKKISAYSWG